MHKTHYLLTFVFYFIILKSFSFSNNLDSVKTYHLKDSIIVIANRYELSVESITNTVDLLKVDEYPGIANHSALQIVDIASSNAYVQEKKIIGYGVGSYGAGSINLRGLGGKPNSGVLVLINGRPDFMGIFGHPLPDVYGLNGISRIETIKGPSSTVFGSNAMGGAINLITNYPKANLIDFSLQGGSYNTFIQHFNGNLKLRKTLLNFYIGHQSTDGHIDLTGFEGWHFEAKLAQKLENNWTIYLEGNYVPYQFDDPLMGPDIANLGRHAKIRRGMADLRAEGNIGKLNNSIHTYINMGHHRFNDGFNSHDFTYGFSSYQHFKYSNSTQLSFGIDILRYGGKATNTANPQAKLNTDKHTVNSFGGYLLGFNKPKSYIMLKGGLRYQYTSLGTIKVIPTFGISYFPTSKLKLTANYNEGFRVPTLQELYLFPSSNPDLESELVRSFELGLVLYFNESNSIETAYFYNQVQNRIQIIPNPSPPPPPEIYVNSGEAKQNGFESSLNYNILNKIQTKLSYSYLNPDNLTAYNPRSLFKFYIRSNYKKLGFSIHGKYVSDLYAGNNYSFRLEDYFLLNLSLGYSFNFLTFNLQLRNILDRKYEVQPGYLAPRIHFLTGLNLKLDKNLLTSNK